MFPTAEVRLMMRVLDITMDQVQGLREQCRLLNWGYAICDAAMRCYGGVRVAEPPKWPYSNYSLS